jgi:hypothetical protein
MIKEPAIAKDETSMPKMPSRGLPMKRKASKIMNETSVTLIDLISPDLALISIIIGIDPGISIIAKRTIKAARISIRLRCMFSNFGAKIMKIELLRIHPLLSLYYFFMPPTPLKGGLFLHTSVILLYFAIKFPFRGMDAKRPGGITHAIGTALGWQNPPFSS